MKIAANCDKGFTLLEALVSLTILALATAAVVPAFHLNLKQNTAMEIKTGAIQAAQLMLDELRAENPADFPESGSDSPVTVTVGNHDYEVIVSYCVNQEYCTSVDTRHIHVQVLFQEEEMYELETVYAKLR